MSTISVSVNMIEFDDGSHGVVLVLPDEASNVIGMDVEDARRLIDCLTSVARVAQQYNEARSHGAVGRTQ